MLALAYVSQVKDKLSRGEYPTEETKCLCGGDNDYPLVETDRYGMPHRMVVCRDCAVIRANPRMTPEAYRSFYNNEYRRIHFADVTDSQRAKGENLRQRLIDFDIPQPGIVVELGCYSGGTLDVFKEAGAQTFGVELDEKAAVMAADKGHFVTRSVDDLLALEGGVKADLVIMQDVIEHLTNLRDMEKVGKLLKPEGHLYVWTPGFFRSSLRALWQLAHTYQFCARSLEYVMGELGFNEIFIDEDIESFWRYVGPGSSYKWKKPAEWAEYLIDDVERKELRRMPPFRGVCKFPPKTLYTNIEANLSKGVPDIHAISRTYSGPVAIIGGGPSVDGQVEEIRALKDKGVPVMAISRMYPWLNEIGVTPDFVVSLDCMEEQEAGFVDRRSGVIYLMASVARPQIFDMLKGEKVYLWDTKDDRKVQALRMKNGYTACTVINGGGSVTLAAMSLAFNLGFTDLHIFGFDCMMPSVERHHAAGIAGPSVEQIPLTLIIQGEEVVTTASFREFTEQALDLVGAAREEGLLNSVKFYGDCLINRMWDGQWHPEEEAA